VCGRRGESNCLTVGSLVLSGRLFCLYGETLGISNFKGQI
jgi:hypothetical protein